jgi:putative hydrolase of the HAD superfamily
MLLDSGGVLLTNGWDHHARKPAATNFKLESAEMGNKCHLTLAAEEA